MCRPPGNKIDSPEGKKAVRCCANGARWQLNEAIRRNPNIMLVPNGGTALSLLRGVKTPIEPYRGRFLVKGDEAFPYEDEAEIVKYVLRGQKPKEDWWPAFETWLKSVMKLYKKAGRSLERRSLKSQQDSWLAENPWLTEWSKLWKKQKAAMIRRLKKETACTPT